MHVRYTHLWPGDNQRYHVGQRLLMLLHSPSAAGLSSPVGGMDGAIPIRQGGAVIAPDGDAPTPSQPPYVDLRWLGARLPHAVSYRSEPVLAAKAANLETPSFGQQRSVGAGKPLSAASGSDASVPAQQASVNAVMDMLSSWRNLQNLQNLQNSQNSQKAQYAAP